METIETSFLSRFIEMPVFESPATMTEEQDEEWNAWLTVTLEPDPRLNDIRKRCVAIDYCMIDQRLSIPCRAALVKYLLQKLRVDSYHHNPEGQQIVVESQCWEKIRQYLMN